MKVKVTAVKRDANAKLIVNFISELVPVIIIETIETCFDIIEISRKV